MLIFLYDVITCMPVWRYLPESFSWNFEVLVSNSGYVPASFGRNDVNG